MKTKLFTTLVLAAAISLVSAEEKKSLGEKTADKVEKAAEKTAENVEKAAEKTKEVAKDAGRAVVDTTKKGAEVVKDALTPDKDAHKVDVRLVEHEIAMPKQLSAGKTAFVVLNAGKAKHNFEIEGEGLEKKFFTNLSPGETKVLHVDLKPGTYKVFCPVGEHEQHGMKLTATVK